jgi:diketogulonate reductase-like aldo/keto reductase
MKQRPFGPTDVEVPIVGQGTWNMEHDDRRSAIRALQRGMDAGMTHIDTAEMYGHGSVEEEIVAPAIQGRRQEVFLVSKVLPSHANREGTVQACEQTLKRLGTDYLDCYLLHWPGDYPLADTVAGFDELQRAGKIRHWGVSNFDELQIGELVHLAGAERIACNQVLYHLHERRIEHAVVPVCEKNGIAVVGYSPLGSGHFPSVGSPEGKVLAEIARAHGVTSHQVALAFLTRRRSMFTIPKASQADHASANAQAGDLELSEDELRRIDQAFPPGEPQPGVPTL